MIYYSHINEDNQVERRLLAKSTCSVVVAIGGSGERVLALMDHMACKKFVVVDVNEHAIFLLQLKLAALTHLSVPEYLQFTGHHALGRKERLQQFDSFKEQLPANALAFWNHKKDIIAKGILYCGHFEKFLHRVKPLVNFYLGGNFSRIFNGHFPERSFPEKRWKLLQKLFSYKIVYRLAGNKDVAFVGSNAQMSLIPVALDRTIKEHKAASSFMAHLVFKGNLSCMAEAQLPPSLQLEVLQAIKQRLLNGEIEIEYQVADLLDYVQQAVPSPEKPVFYSLSDILSFTDAAYLMQGLKSIAVAGNLIVGRSFLRNRLTGSQLRELCVFGQVEEHDASESTGMYQVFSVKV